MTNEPKLAVILHADIVGSTLLVQRDERLAHARIQETFGHLAECVTRYGGTAHEIRGDALVAEFERVSDAVCAALAFQSANDERYTATSDDISPVVRMGLALGEVVIADKTITGPGVVIAQRLEQLADGGRVVLQGAVYEAMPKRLPLDYEYLGERELKGFAERTRAYLVGIREGESVPSPSRDNGRSAAERPVQASIGVLPFRVLSSDSNHEYLADGLTADINDHLAHLPGLTVIANSSMLVYRDVTRDVREIAAEIDVRHVMEGAIRAAGHRLRVSVELIDGATGKQIWNQRYDRDADDVFALQDAITLDVVRQVHQSLSHGDVRVRHETENLVAWSEVRRGLPQLEQLNKEGILQARKHFETAVNADEGYVFALALLGWTYMAELRYGLTSDCDATMESLTGLVGQLADLNAEHAETNALRSWWSWYRGDFDLASTFAHRAVDEAPNSARILSLCARTFYLNGEWDAAIRGLGQALRLDPHGSLTLRSLTVALAFRGDTTDAVRCGELAVERSSEAAKRATALYRLAFAYMRGNHSVKAERAVATAQKLAPATIADVVADLPFRTEEHCKLYASELMRAGVPS